MRVNYAQHNEDFWIQKVERSVDEGAELIYVPLAALPRAMAMNLAVKHDVTVFIKDDSYLFSTDPKTTQSLLKEEDTLH